MKIIDFTKISMKIIPNKFQKAVKVHAQSGILKAPNDYPNPNLSLSSHVQESIKSLLPNRILLRPNGPNKKITHQPPMIRILLRSDTDAGRTSTRKL